MTATFLSRSLAHDRGEECFCNGQGGCLLAEQVMFLLLDLWWGWGHEL